jgi:hypothetical protein
MTRSQNRKQIFKEAGNILFLEGNFLVSFISPATSLKSLSAMFHYRLPVFSVNWTEGFYYGIGSYHSTTTSLARINNLISNLNNEISNGHGRVNALLKDAKMKTDLSNSLKNIEMGTKAFNENMDAIKHSFLSRKYFRSIENKKSKSHQPY